MSFKISFTTVFGAVDFINSPDSCIQPHITFSKSLLSRFIIFFSSLDM